MSDEKRRLPLLTNSSLTTFRRCPREYYYAYVLRRRAVRKSDALRFGTLFHVGLNAWWTWTGDADVKLASATLAMSRKAEEYADADPFELVKAEELMLGYTARWGDEPYETLAVEKQFRLPLLSPRSSHPQDSATGFDQGGAIDAIARIGSFIDELNHEATVHVVEHKTTSQDISPGAPYWNNIVALDSQVSTYMEAARELGYAPRDCIYDVIRKPDVNPLKATPEESKKYTKPTKAEPVPRLYSGQREEDETPEEYRARLRKDITKSPDWYYQRMTVVRLEHDDAGHERDTLETACMIRFAEERNAWPRSTKSCERYRRLCDYHPVCSGTASINDLRFETKESTHEELGDI